MRPTPTLEADHLSKRFGRIPALTDATFRYDRNGAIGYLGPNGAGKTTTLKLFAGLIRPSDGAARINGIDVLRDPKRALWDVGALIETPEPYPQHTVEEALRTVGSFRGIPEPRMTEQIRHYHELLELPPLPRRTGKLSKGQKQRVIVAATLLSEPSVLLLDEPSSGLDPAERVAVRSILQALKRDRLILMSSHLLQEVTEVCDRVIFINQGKILLQESVEGIERRFRVTRLDVEFSAPVPSDRMKTLMPLVSGIVPLSDRSFRLDFDGSPEARADILRRCQALGAVIGFSVAGLTLEDAYLKLIQPGAGAVQAG